MTDPIAVTLDEASRMSGMSKRRIQERIAEGRIDAAYEGRKPLVLVRSLRAYLEGLPREPAPT
jgi:hypothetical protein